VSNTEKDGNKKRFWRQRFRITIQEESTFHERRAYLLSGRRIASIVAGITLFIGLFTYMGVAHTPLAEYLVPGFIAKRYRADVARVRQQSDSALFALVAQEKYLKNLKSILLGEIPVDLQMDSITDGGLEGDLPEASDNDIALRDRVENEDRYALRRSGPESLSTLGFDFQPVVGGVSDVFDLSAGHRGVDIEAAEGVLIHSVDDGTVLMSDYTVEHGYVIVVQHRNNRVSIYKHNASLLKEVGDLVKKGSAIASIGNSGTQTTGPHLHFEWWVNGQPIDPSPWLSFFE